MIFYLYRYRAWDKNCYYGARDVSAINVDEHWGEWEWIDAQKYEEILKYIAWEHPCHYQAEKIACTVADRASFSPTKWIEEQVREQ